MVAIGSSTSVAIIRSSRLPRYRFIDFGRYRFLVPTSVLIVSYTPVAIVFPTSVVIDVTMSAGERRSVRYSSNYAFCRNPASIQPFCEGLAFNGGDYDSSKLSPSEIPPSGKLDFAAVDMT